MIGLGRLAGRTIGVLASNPLRKGGCLDSLSAEKASRFARMCDALPRATLVTRKSHGGAYIAMNSRPLGATTTYLTTRSNMRLTLEHIYMRLLNLLAELAFKNENSPDSPPAAPFRDRGG